MSNYGSSLYGINFYGPSVTAGSAAGYYASNLTTNHVGYRKIELSWDNVSPLTSEIIYAWKIVKTVGGAPDYPNSAPVVTSGINTAGTLTSFYVPSNSLLDTDSVFPAGIIITYSMWILVGTSTSTRNWVNVGTADAIIVEDDNETTYKLLKLLPNVWTSVSGEVSGEPDIPETDSDSSTDIYKFLKNFGFYYDKLRAEVKAVSKISDYRMYPHKLLPYAVTSLGFNYEPTLGDNYHRSLYRSGNIINSLKGTRLGLQKYIKSLTNFNSNISLGRNILPSSLESSFEGGTGTWYCLNGGLVYKSRTTNPDTPPSAATVLSNSSLSNGYAWLIKNSSSNPILKSYGSETTTQETIAKLIPVSPGVPYLFSGWARGGDGNISSTSTITAQIRWFNNQGVFLSSATAGTSVTLTSGTVGSSGPWLKFESSNTYSATYAPANAAYAGIYITTSGLSSSDSIALDYFSFGVYPSLVASVNYGIGDSIYDEARDIKIAIKGYRTNYLNNPNFEEGISSWNVLSDGTGTFVQDFSQTAPYSGGATVAKFNGVGSVLYSDWVKNLSPSTYYTFSISVKSASAIGVKAAIEFNAPQKSSVQSNQFADSAGTYFTPTQYKTTSSEVTLAGDTWTRISVTALSPEYFSPNGLPSAVVSIEFTSTPSANWWVDAAMLEESLTAGPYFQGNGGPAPDDLINTDYIYPSDCAWETRLRTNLIANSGFEGGSISRWSISSGSGVLSTTTTYAKFGTYSGSVAYTSATSAVATSVRLPVKMTNGSTYVFPNIGDVLSGSVYVYATVSGKFQLNVKSSDTSSLSYSELGSNPSQYVYAQTGNWVRLDKSIILNTAIYTNPYVTFEVKFTADSGTTGTWYLDGAQLEVGDVVSSYVNTSSGSTYSTLTNTGLSRTVTAVNKTLYSTDFGNSGVTGSTAYATFFGAGYAISTTGTIGLSSTTTANHTGDTNGASLQIAVTGTTGGTVTARLQGNTSSTTKPPSKIFPGYSYSASVWARSSAASSPQTNVCATITWLDSSYAFISTSTGTTGTNSTTFANYTVTVSAASVPSNAAYAYVGIQYVTNSTTTNCYIDDASLSSVDTTQYTLTAGINEILVGDTVNITGITPSTYNTSAALVLSVDSSTQVTVVNSGSGAASFSSATLTPVNSFYATTSTMSGIGRSYYWPNKTTKFSRLQKTISNYLPLGSTYTISYGVPNTPVNEYAGSIVRSSLLAHGTYGWEAVSATNLTGALTSSSLSTSNAPKIARYIGAGGLAKIASNYYSGAFTSSLLSLENTNTQNYIGIRQKNIKVSPGTSYNLSTALGFTTLASAFKPVYVVTWYDNSDFELSTVAVTDNTSVTVTNASTTSGSKTITFDGTNYQDNLPLVGDLVIGYSQTETQYVRATSVSINSATKIVTVTTDTNSNLTSSTLTLTFQSLNYASNTTSLYTNYTYPLEANTSVWYSGTNSNSTYSNETTIYRTSSPSLKITPTAAPGIVAAYAGNGLTPVVGGETYLATGYIKSSSGTRTANLTINWFTSAGAYISTSFGSATSTNSTAWTKVTHTATAPSNAGLVIIGAVIQNVTSLTDYQYLDDVTYEKVIANSETVRNIYPRSTGSWGNFAARVVSPNTAAYATVAVLVKPHYPSSTNKTYLSRVVMAPYYGNSAV